MDTMQRATAAAQAMRELPEEARDEAIAASDNVFDARPFLTLAERQRHLAEAYRRGDI